MVCCWLERAKMDLHGLECVRDPAQRWEEGSVVRGAAGQHRPGPSQAGTLLKPRPAPAASVLHAHTAAPAGRLQSKTHQSEYICKKESGQKTFFRQSRLLSHCIHLNRDRHNRGFSLRHKTRYRLWIKSTLLLQN